MANLTHGWINHLRPQARSDQACVQDAALMAKPDREVTKSEDGKFICTWPDCNELVKKFQRKCEWSKHMDEHKRPYAYIDKESFRMEGQTVSSTPFSIDNTTPCGRSVPEDVLPARKRLKSPLLHTRRSSIWGDLPTGEDFPQRPPPRTQGRLWNEGDPIPTRPSPPKTATNTTQRTRARKQPSQSVQPEEEDPSVNKMIGQPETRPISQEQLVAEVKGIYAGLVMAESKCIEVDSSQTARARPELNNEQWQALIALYRTLLHEHHDFFLASQHPSASSALRRLASKYAMPASMWRHGIHSFLELLRHQLPNSPDHMLTFIYLAYSMMALLYETVPNFEDTWIECLGDLGRYRMAVEDEDIRDREIWTEVSRSWYSKATKNLKAPTTGRLHHHLAILARPNAVKQLFYYTKSLCVAIPFKSARDSILTLFESLPSEDQSLRGRLWPGTDQLFPDDWFRGSQVDEGERNFELPLTPGDSGGRVSWRGSGDGHFNTPGLYSEPSDVLHIECPSDGRTMPRHLFSHLYLLSTIPNKFLGLAVLTAMAIPVVSAELPGRDIITMAWTFGIMANVPSVYVLANPPMSSGVDGGAEEVIWKIARGWGLTCGPVFASVLVVLLRAILPRGKRVAFIALVFAMSLVAMLLLKLFMRDDTWSVLDLFALCVSFCGVAAYIITNEPRDRNAVGGDVGLEGGRPQYPQDNQAVNQPAQPPQATQPEDHAVDDHAAGQQSIRSDDPFIIGDDSTLGDGESRS